MRSIVKRSRGVAEDDERTNGGRKSNPVLSQLDAKEDGAMRSMAATTRCKTAADIAYNFLYTDLFSQQPNFQSRAIGRLFTISPRSCAVFSGRFVDKFIALDNLKNNQMNDAVSRAREWLGRWIPPARPPPDVPVSDNNPNDTMTIIRALNYDLSLDPPLLPGRKSSPFKDARLKIFCQKYLPRYDLLFLQGIPAYSSSRQSYLFDQATLNGLDYIVYSPRRFSGTLQIDAGLIVLSKFPIEQSRITTYPRGRVGDMFRARGVIYTRIIMPGNVKVHVFTTMLQKRYGGKKLGLLKPTSNNDVQSQIPDGITSDWSYTEVVNVSIDPDFQIQLQQLRLLRRFIDVCMKDVPNAGNHLNPLVVCGDFSIDARNSLSSTNTQPSTAYKLMIDVLSGMGIPRIAVHPGIDPWISATPDGRVYPRHRVYMPRNLVENPITREFSITFVENILIPFKESNSSSQDATVPEYEKQKECVDHVIVMENPYMITEEQLSLVDVAGHSSVHSSRRHKSSKKSSRRIYGNHVSIRYRGKRLTRRTFDEIFTPKNQLAILSIDVKDANIAVNDVSSVNIPTKACSIEQFNANYKDIQDKPTSFPLTDLSSKFVFISCVDEYCRSFWCSI